MEDARQLVKVLTTCVSMDWLRTVQKQAQEAAEKLISSEAASTARTLAQQATLQARTLAEQASTKAREVAKEALDEAGKSFAPLKSGAEADPRAYGISKELQEFVSNLAYSTFSDYPLDTLDLPADPSNQRLSPWQETHATIILKKVPQLQDLRFVLCPRRMDEYLFWSIYFTLCLRYLPPPESWLVPSPQQQQQQQAGSSARPAEAAAPDAPGAANRTTSNSSRIGSTVTAGVAGAGGSSSSLPGTAVSRGAAAALDDAGPTPALEAPPPPAELGSAAGSAAKAAAGGAEDKVAAAGVAGAGGGAAESASEKTTAAAAAADSSGGTGARLSQEALQQLEGGEMDRELDAYLQEALVMDNDDGSDGVPVSDDLEDLEDFMKELDG